MKDSPLTPTPVTWRRVARRTPRIVKDVVIYFLGMMITVGGISSVPGAATVSGDTATLTDLGVAIGLIGMIAWGVVFFSHHSPLFPLIAGAILAAIGTDYLLLLYGAHCALVVWPPTRRRQVSLISIGIVVAFVLREFLTPWADLSLIAISLRNGTSSTSSEVLVFVLTTVFACLAILLSFGSAILIRVRRESRAHLDRADEEHSKVQELSSELDRQTERESLARDIHDALAHRLSVISLQSGALEEATRSQDESVARAAQTLRQQAHASLDDLRSLLGELRRESTQTDEYAVPPSMASMRTIGHLIRSARESGAQVDTFVMLEGAEHAGAALDRTTYRIVQESLTNALRHAPGASVSLYLEAAPGSGVRVRVSNPIAPGLAPSTAGTGSGIVGIKERAQLLGGTAWIGESEGHFLVDVSLPWPVDG